jgi:hypothetical protein
MNKLTHFSVIAGLDPAIHHLCKKINLRKRMDARVEPAHDEGG